MKPPNAHLRRLTAERDVLRQALVLIAAVARCETFTDKYAPIASDHESNMEWLHAALLPVQRQSPALRLAVRLLDYDGAWFRTWDDPRWARRELRRLRAQVAKGTTAFPLNNPTKDTTHD